MHIITAQGDVFPLPTNVSWDGTTGLTIGSKTYTYTTAALARVAYLTIIAALTGWDGHQLINLRNNTPTNPITLTSISPSSAMMGAEVTLTGTNFTKETTFVYVGLVLCFVVKFISSTSIIIKVPTGLTINTTYDITITDTGANYATLAGALTILTPYTLVSIADDPFNPVTSTITITGTGFTAGKIGTIQIGSIVADNWQAKYTMQCTFVSDTKLTAVYLSGPWGGDLNLTTYYADSDGVFSNSLATTDDGLGNMTI